MNRSLLITLLVIISTIIQSCADHDDPQLLPIDTTQVKITATVKDSPNTSWLNITEELTISVSYIEMSAPKGVVLRSISLIANTGTGRYSVDDKPYSGKPLEFKVPLVRFNGRVSFSLRGNLIKKGCRDAEIIIADNIQKIVFSEEPIFKCEGCLYVSVKSKSTSGEIYENSFEVRSTDDLIIPIPQSKLYWTPQDGTASTLEIALGAGGTAWSPNTTLDCKITKSAIGHSTGDDAILRLSIPNIPRSLGAEKLQEYIVTSYFGTWENISIEPYNLTNVFSIVEVEE